MRNLWPRSILARTTFILLISSGLTGAVFIILASSVIAGHSNRIAIDRLNELIETVERTVSIACYLTDKPLAVEVAQGLMKNKEVYSVTIRDSENDELAKLTRPTGTEETKQSELSPIHHLVISPFDPNTIAGELILVPDQREISRRTAHNVNLIRNLLILELLVLSTAVVLMVLLLVTRPIKQVSNRLHKMDASAGDKLLPPYGHTYDEIGRLVEDVNDLANRLVLALREEQAIRQQREADERKYHAIFDNSEAGICLLDAKGRVLSHNPAFVRMTGLNLNDEASLLNLKCSDPGSIHAALNRCLEQNVTATEKIEMVRMENTRWLHLILTPIGRARAQGVISDITELTLAKQFAEDASRAKSAFLSNMSHELRTPLNAIIGFAQLLEFDELNEEQQESVGYILNGGRHLLTLINEILDLARIESGRFQYNIETVEVPSLLDEIVAFLQPSALANQIIIQQLCTGNYFIQADQSRTKQVLLNLMSNAIKYNKENGSVALSCDPNGNYLRITVADTGKGISDSYQAEVFQPFQRLGAEKTAIEGTGIGLVVCKELIEAMGGKIGFESTLNIGSQFWIELPQALADNAIAVESSLIPSEALSNLTEPLKGRVLYIEDSIANIQVMKQVFNKLPGTELLIAENAEIGLALIDKQLPDLVLMDINLPDMNGLEALHLLKSNPDTAAIPVIAVSAIAESSDIEVGINAGFLAYITKPFNVQELIGLVGKTLG